jgi:glycosyltransferase involved in cell wall biosynthesis
MGGDEFESLVCTLRPNPDEPTPDGVIALQYAKWDPRSFWGVAKTCREHNIDILHAHLPKSIISCIFASYFCNLALVIHEHGGGIFNKGLGLYRMILKSFHQRASVVIAVSQAIEGALVERARIGKEKIRIVYSPVDLRPFDISRISRTQARNDLGISDNDYVIGFVGRLHSTKAVDRLIRATASLLERSGNFLLLVVGDGPERDSLERLTDTLGVAERVRFLGVCQNIPEIMAALDIGVMPSLHEPFGRVAIEFMRMKVPVVSSGLAGLAELTIDAQTGVVTKENTPDGIRSAIESLMNDQGLKATVTENGYSFSEKFAIERHVDRLRDIYRKILRS